MSTSKGFIEFLNDNFSHIPGLYMKAMFGEYALYKDGVVIGLICDNTLFIKITPNTTKILGENHEKGYPYPKAKPQFIIGEDIIEDNERIYYLFNMCKIDIDNKI